MPTLVTTTASRAGTVPMRSTADGLAGVSPVRFSWAWLWRMWVRAVHRCRGSRSPSRCSGLTAETSRYGTPTTATSTTATPFPYSPNSRAATTAARASPAPPSNHSPARPTRTHPAVTAPNPSSPARLNTFDPNTTPSPRSWFPPRMAVTAVAISGESAARAVSTPSSPSLSRIHVPSWSTRSARTRPETMPTTSEARNTVRATGTDIVRGLRGAAGLYPAGRRIASGVAGR